MVRTTLRRRHRVALATVACVALAATGCWLQPGAGAGNDNHNPFESVLTPATVGTLVPRWSAPGTVSAVSGGHAVGVHGSDVRSLDLATGAERWRTPVRLPFDLGSPWFPYPPAVAGDHVVFPWTATFPVPRPPQLITTGSGSRVRLADGSFDAGVHPPSSLGGPRSIVPAGDVVMFETPEGELRVSSATEVTSDPTPVLRPLWHTAAGASAARPIVAGTMVVDADGATLRGFPLGGCPASPCAPAWSTALTGDITALAAGPGGRVLAVTAGAGAVQPTLSAVEAATGTVVGRFTLPAPGSSLAVDGATAFVAGDQDLFAFDVASCGASDCPPAWRAFLSGARTANLAVAGGVVYAGTDAGGGRVDAFPAAGCGGPACAPLTTLTVPGAPVNLLVTGGFLLATTAGPSPTVTAYAPTT